MSVRIANVRESPHKTIEVLVVIVMLLIALPVCSQSRNSNTQSQSRCVLISLHSSVIAPALAFPLSPMSRGRTLASSSTRARAMEFLLGCGSQMKAIWSKCAGPGKTRTSTRRTSRPNLPRQRVILDQFHGDFSHETPIEDWASWARPFVLASVGATHVSGNTNISFTRFSFGIGAGIRFYASRHLGFKIQAEWLPVFVDPNVAFICGSGCIVHAGGTASSQGEVFVGPILRF